MVVGINIDKVNAKLIYCLFGHTFGALLWPLLWLYLAFFKAKTIWTWVGFAVLWLLPN